ncbi:unnamed protein product, partial [Phaeothamnion confervicola]
MAKLNLGAVSGNGAPRMRLPMEARMQAAQGGGCPRQSRRATIRPSPKPRSARGRSSGAATSFIVSLDDTTQVGGHRQTAFKPGMLLLRLPDWPPLVLKPLQSGGRGSREVSFYELVARGHGTFWRTLREMTPPYLGVVRACQQLSGGGGSGGGSGGCGATVGSNFVVLEDMTRGYRAPCVLDVKMGTRTYESDAPMEKARYEFMKYPDQEVTGFRFVGMRGHVWDPSSGRLQPHRRDKHWGLALPAAEAARGFAEFFHDGRRLRAEVIAALLPRLRALLAWMRDQWAFRFVSTSLLFVWDADAEGNDGFSGASDDGSGGGGGHCSDTDDVFGGGDEDRGGGIRSDGASRVKADVRMIDFTHAHYYRNDPAVAAGASSPTSATHGSAFPSASGLPVPSPSPSAAALTESREGVRDEGYIYGLRNVLAILEQLATVQLPPGVPPSAAEAAVTHMRRVVSLVGRREGSVARDATPGPLQPSPALTSSRGRTVHLPGEAAAEATRAAPAATRAAMSASPMFSQAASFSRWRPDRSPSPASRSSVSWEAASVDGGGIRGGGGLARADDAAERDAARWRPGVAAAACRPSAVSRSLSPSRGGAHDTTFGDGPLTSPSRGDPTAATAAAAW